jgi:hypothetical protein
LNQEDKATEYFRRSEKDILRILTFLDKENQESIIPTKILYPILDDPNTIDGSFFKETLKGIDIDEKKLSKCKEAYILSISIISQLHIKDENEKLVTYYTNKIVSQKMLFKHKEGSKSEEEKISKFRLNAINYSNDRTEGKSLLYYLFKEKDITIEDLNAEYGAFAGCFTFNCDSLNQFRLYGKEKGEEGTGLSLVFKDSFFSKEAKMPISKETKTDIEQLKTKENDLSKRDEDKRRALFRCIYIDPIAHRVETVGHKEAYLFYRENEEKSDEKKESDKAIEEKIKNYHEYITIIIENVENKMRKLKKLVEDEELAPIIVGKLLINLRYLTKHIAFKEEQECRIVGICPLNGSREQIEIDEDFKQMYVEYDPIVSNHINKIYFGPKATGMELFQDILIHKNIHIPCKKSTNPLA